MDTSVLAYCFIRPIDVQKTAPLELHGNAARAANLWFGSDHLAPSFNARGRIAI
jgi:hypothetical protein